MITIKMVVYCVYMDTGLCLQVVVTRGSNANEILFL